MLLEMAAPGDAGSCQTRLQPLRAAGQRQHLAAALPAESPPHTRAGSAAAVRRARLVPPGPAGLCGAGGSRAAGHCRAGWEPGCLGNPRMLTSSLEGKPHLGR